MRKWKQNIAFVLMFVVLATFAPVSNVEAKGTAKLGQKDFVCTNFKGKKENIFKMSKEYDSFYSYFCKIIDNKNKKGSSTKKFKTNRKVALGSTEAYVKKQYGKTSKIKVNAKEKWYKYMKYNLMGLDYSAWKSYLEYNYTKGKDKYKIRFYLDKKNKVTAVVYLKNLHKFNNYPNKEINPGLTFQAPKGKKVTTKTINGKKVYMIPKGSKIKLKKVDGQMSVIKYDVYGKEKAFSDLVFAAYNLEEDIKAGKSYDLEKLINNGGDINTKKLGKYLYLTLRYENYDYDENGEIKNSKAPAIYYFKFK